MGLSVARLCRSMQLVGQLQGCWRMVLPRVLMLWHRAVVLAVYWCACNSTRVHCAAGQVLLQF